MKLKLSQKKKMKNIRKEINENQKLSVFLKSIKLINLYLH